MKYIKTKDKIEKAPDDYANKLIECHSLKVADTIEELCDEFVVVGYTTKPLKCSLGDKKLFNSKTKWLCINLNEYGERNGYDLKTFLKTKIKCTIYGAIWTDKGLTYVAKMNDEGELELYGKGKSYHDYK